MWQSPIWRNVLPELRHELRNQKTPNEAPSFVDFLVGGDGRVVLTEVVTVNVCQQEEANRTKQDHQ